MKVFITGAAGFVGLNIIKALKNTPHAITALVRSTTKTDYLDRFNVTKLKGDVTDAQRMIEATEGMDAIIHCAGVTSGFAMDRKSVFHINVTGTKNLLKAAEINKIKRFVFTSTTSTIGNKCNGRLSDENHQLAGYRAKSQYGLSKLECEKWIMKSVEKGLNAIILNPAEVLGPYDFHFGWGSVIYALHHKALPVFPNGGASFCHSEEVGKAHVAALEKGKIGERYILGGTNIPIDEFIDKICRLTGCEKPAKKSANSNYTLLKLLYLNKMALYPLTKKKPFIDAHRLKTFFKYVYYKSDKAVAELGYKIRPIDEMIMDCFNWYKANQYI